MYISKDRDDTLIIRGYGWQRFAAALLFLLLTPLWVWLALKVNLNGDIMAQVFIVLFAAGFPLHIFVMVKKKYEDWLLVFEADYDLVGFYEPNWGGRELTRRIALNEITNAQLLEKTNTYTDRGGTQRTAYSYHLTLNTSTDPADAIIVEGEEVDIYRMQSRINGWLESHRRRRLAQSRQNTSTT